MSCPRRTSSIILSLDCCTSFRRLPEGNKKSYKPATTGAVCKPSTGGGSSGTGGGGIKGGTGGVRGGSGGGGRIGGGGGNSFRRGLKMPGGALTPPWDLYNM